MPSDCEIATKDHLIHTGHDIVMEQMIRQWPTTWNISQLLFDLSPEDLVAHIKDIHLDSQTPTTARNLKQLLNTGTGTVAIGITAVIVILAVAVMIIFGYMGYRYYVIRKNANVANTAGG